MDCMLTIPPHLDDASVFGINDDPARSKADGNAIGSTKTPIWLKDNLASFDKGGLIHPAGTRDIVVKEVMGVNTACIGKILMRGGGLNGVDIRNASNGFFGPLDEGLQRER